MAPSTRCHISLHKRPDKTILPHPFNHRVDLVLPTDLYLLLSDSLHSSSLLKHPLLCHQLHVPLSAVLETAFFTKYIKTGNVIMLSRGRIDIDNVYSLNDGVLRLSLRKDTYEKSGLVGQPSRFGNTSGKKKPSRYTVEINLRDPAMLHGKKGFERIVWSFTNVLKDTVDFMFCDLEQTKSPSPLPPCPILVALGALPRNMNNMHLSQIPTSSTLRVPSFHPPPGSMIRGGGGSLAAEYQRDVWQDWALHVYEWLALVSLGPADRIMASDNVDPYLSTYSVEQAEGKKGGMPVTRLTFRGLLPALWIADLWKFVCDSLSASASPEGRNGWAALTVHGFENSPISWNNSAHGCLDGGENGYTVLRLPSGEAKDGGGDIGRCIIYEVVGSQDEHS